jgi:hypothetical protein
MRSVFTVDELPWKDLRGLPGARGFEFKPLTDASYTKAYSCELVRLDPAIIPFLTSNRGVICSTF